MDGRARLHQVRRSLRPVADDQLALGLEPAGNPRSEAALRAAYRRVDISRRLSYEQAMSRTACAIGIRNLAEAIARRIGGR
jgi:hypothetical protein